MDAVALLRMQVEGAHNWLEGTLGNLTDAQMQWVPPGKANPAGVCFAHVATAEDMVVNAMLKGGAPFSASTWKGKTGLSEPMPMPGPDWPKYFDWTRRVKINGAQLRQYAKAVFANTDAYLKTLKSSDLDREAPVPGFGNKSLGWIIGELVVGHCHDETGEISAVKGAQGLKGYPEGQM